MAGKKGRRLINARRLRSYLPSVKKIAIAGLCGKGLSKTVRNARCGSLDAVCECAEIGLNVLKRGDFKKSDMAKMAAYKDGIRFLAEYSKCRTGKKKCLRTRRDKKILQSGRGLGILLSTVLPIVASFIASKL